MTRRRSLFQRFQKECETNDNHFDPDLKSHYYKASFDKVYQAVLDIFQNDKDFKISSTSKERGEIAINMLKRPKAFIVATVVQVRPFETAVDFMVSSEQFSVTGLYPTLKKEVVKFYRILDQQLPLIGTKS